MAAKLTTTINKIQFVPNQTNSAIIQEFYQYMKDSNPNSDPRTLIPLQMMLPNGQWSKTVVFNFDTGASWPTDIPPQHLSVDLLKIQLLRSFLHCQVTNAHFQVASLLF